jgi:hypothetical protein
MRPCSRCDSAGAGAELSLTTRPLQSLTRESIQYRMSWSQARSAGRVAVHNGQDADNASDLYWNTDC